ncbi:MAG TPA: Uma2 family endonuclease [Dehalococcoidia bacterium]|nr:Uma2 family endonuclease [Dehalococcoidia bacterium]
MAVVRHRFSVEDYHRMAQAGILGEDDRVELIDGEVVHMAPMGSRHGAQVRRLQRRLERALEDRASVSVQSPLRLGEFSEPEPDLALLRPREDDYASAHPGAGDVLLVIEVGDTSADYDRQVKVPLYARHGVPEVWLIDLERGQVEVYRGPQGEGYAEVLTLGPDGSLVPSAFPDLSLPLRELLVP